MRRGWLGPRSLHAIALCAHGDGKAGLAAGFGSVRVWQESTVASRMHAQLRAESLTISFSSLVPCLQGSQPWRTCTSGPGCA